MLATNFGLLFEVS